MFVKDPSAVLDYAVDWTRWLAPGETIVAVVWTPSATGITVANPSNTDTVATVWLSDGLIETTYTLECHITTSAGRQDSRKLVVEVVKRLN